MLDFPCRQLPIPIISSAPPSDLAVGAIFHEEPLLHSSIPTTVNTNTEPMPTSIPNPLHHLFSLSFTFNFKSQSKLSLSSSSSSFSSFPYTSLLPSIRSTPPSFSLPLQFFFHCFPLLLLKRETMKEKLKNISLPRPDRTLRKPICMRCDYLSPKIALVCSLPFLFQKILSVAMPNFILLGSVHFTQTGHLYLILRTS